MQLERSTNSQPGLVLLFPELLSPATTEFGDVRRKIGRMGPQQDGRAHTPQLKGVASAKFQAEGTRQKGGSSMAGLPNFSREVRVANL